MKQFVDPKSSALMRRLQGKEAEAQIDDIGDVYVEGEYAGHMAGLQFQRDPRLSHTLRAPYAALWINYPATCLRPDRPKALANAPDSAFSLNLGQIMWNPTDQSDAGADRTACVGQNALRDRSPAPYGSGLIAEESPEQGTPPICQAHHRLAPASSGCNPVAAGQIA